MKANVLLWSVALIGIIIVGRLPAHAASLSEALSADWRSRTELAKLFPDISAVQAFARRLLVAREGEDADIDPPTVLDYRLVDLQGTGRVQLVYRLDYSGRGVSRYLIVIDKINGRLRLTTLDPGVELGPLDRILVDLNQDGRTEILVDYPLAGRKDEAAPYPYFEAIYLYRPGIFVPADRQFIAYYRNVLLPKLERRAGLLHEQIEKSSSPEEMENLQEQLAANETSVTAIKRFMSGR